MSRTKSFDNTVKKLCRKKISDPQAPILEDVHSVEQEIAAAVIKRAMSGATDSVKLIREILDDGKEVCGGFRVDINVVE